MKNSHGLAAFAAVCSIARNVTLQPHVVISGSWGEPDISDGCPPSERRYPSYGPSDVTKNSDPRKVSDLGYLGFVLTKCSVLIRRRRWLVQKMLFLSNPKNKGK